METCYECDGNGNIDFADANAIVRVQKENKIMNRTRLEHLKNSFIDEEITLYKNDFERKQGIEFEYILNDLFGSKLSEEELENIQEITIQVSAIKNIE